MANDKEIKLNALVANYELVINDIWNYQKEGDTGSWWSIIAGVSGPLLTFFHVDKFLITLICFFVPILQIFGLQRGLQSHMFVAMLRGYAAYLEDEINKLLEDKIFLYNSVYIDRYIASQTVINERKLKTSLLVTYLSNFAISFICMEVILFNRISSNSFYYIFIAIVFIAYAIVIGKLCNDFSVKEKKRLEARFPDKFIVEDSETIQNKENENTKVIS